MKTGAEREPWICGLIMPERQRVHKNDYSKRACDSVAPDSSCVALHGVSVGVVWSYSYDLTGMQQQQQSACGLAACRSRFHGYTTF